jgi:hypothetical protein
MKRVDKDVEAEWNDFWKPILFKRGKLNLSQLKKELFDYSQVMHEVSLVYDHITNGAISKPNTRHEDVIAVADDYVDELVAMEMED